LAEFQVNLNQWLPPSPLRGNSPYKEEVGLFRRGEFGLEKFTGWLKAFRALAS